MMPQADRDHTIALSERVHLCRPVPVIDQRAMYEYQGRTLALLEVGQIGAIHSDSLDLGSGRSITAHTKHEEEQDEHAPSQSFHGTPSLPSRGSSRSRALWQLLENARKHHTHAAMWARVYRGLAGLLTLQDHRLTKNDDDPTSFTPARNEADRVA